MIEKKMIDPNNVLSNQLEMVRQDIDHLVDDDVMQRALLSQLNLIEQCIKDFIKNIISGLNCEWRCELVKEYAGERLAG